MLSIFQMMAKTKRYIYSHIHASEDKGVKWEVRHIYREFNQTADALANAPLDDENGNGPSKHW